MICLFCNSDRVQRLMVLVTSSGVAYWKCLDCSATWAG